MKNLFVLLLFVFSVSFANAQLSKAEWMVEAGYSSAHFASIKHSGNYPAAFGDRSQNINSFNAGLRINIPLKKALYLQSGLSIAGKGGISQIEGIPWFYEKDTITSFYFEIPLNIIFKKKISKSSNCFIGTGMYGAMGIVGKNRYAGWSGDFIGFPFSGSSNLQFGKSSNSMFGFYNTLKQFDYGANFLCGIEIKKISFKINYSLGLTDVANDNNYKGRNAVLSFNIGYRIK
ncbi:hypothetical protein GALL_128120 [mine drainage metagenome]|uniref:Uncharacterized protein n=1 Tax=mine drainage metagenome TaxID=410659 RepID=A0A1J5STQ5_9ZZZZ